MIQLGIQDREIRTPRDLNRVLTFKCFGVLGRGKDVPNPTGEIGRYTSREGIS